jgi:hypothetical protein
MACSPPVEEKRESPSHLKTELTEAVVDSGERVKRDDEVLPKESEVIKCCDDCCCNPVCETNSCRGVLVVY